MRLGIASTFPPYRGGIAQFNAAMARSLKDHGHEVHCMTWRRQYPSLLFPGTSQWEPGASIRDVDMPAPLDSLNPLSWKETGRQLAAHSDVAILPFWHAALAPALTSVAREAKRQGIGRVLALMHNASSHDGRGWHLRLTERFLRTVDGVVTLSEPVSDALLDWQPHTLFHPLYDHLAAAVGQKEARRKLGLDDRAHVHLFFGLIRPYKGLNVLLEALAKLPEDHVLVVAGECYGPWEPYAQLIAKHGLAQRVVVHNEFIDDRDVPVYFAAADNLVLPYVEASQSGVTALALHHKRKVIASDVGDLSNSIVPELTGRLVRPNDISALSEAMTKPGLAQPSEIDAAFNQIKKRLSWSAWAAQLTQQVESDFSAAR
ncbi:MAG: glycosyltransferase [Bacteroidota bacterium]|nr:glycosyltransferase [Bacteroidota bacterium]